MWMLFILLFMLSLAFCDVPECDTYAGSPYFDYRCNLGATPNLGDTYCSEKVYQSKLENCQTVDFSCQGKADVVFVLDKSGTVKNCEFQIVRNFTMEILCQLEVTHDLVNVGGVSFAGAASHEWVLSGDKETVFNSINAVENLAMGSTHLWEGLEAAANELDARTRPNVNKFVVVMSDGNTQEKWKEQEQIDRIEKELGGIIIAIAVNSEKQSDIDHLKMNISSSLDHFTSVKTFQDLKYVVNIINDLICMDVFSIDPKSVCGESVFSYVPGIEYVPFANEWVEDNYLNLTIKGTGFSGHDIILLRMHNIPNGEIGYRDFEGTFVDIYTLEFMLPWIDGTPYGYHKMEVSVNNGISWTGDMDLLVRVCYDPVVITIIVASSSCCILCLLCLLCFLCFLCCLGCSKRRKGKRRRRLENEDPDVVEPLVDRH